MSFLEKNMEVLREHRPELVDAIPPDGTGEGTFLLTTAESGEARVVFTARGGEEVRIHSTEDPVKCAKDAVDLLNKTEKEGLIVLLGFGLGYFAQELLKHFETGHMMLVYEATPQLFKTALKARDLTDVLSSKKVEMLIGPDADDFSFLFRYHHHLMHGTLYVIGHLPSLRLNEDAYARFRKRIDEEKRLSLSNVSTALGLGKNFADTFMENLPNILRMPGVTALKGIFKGRPAIVVAAGPSLEKNLHLLKEAKSKAVIIAVDAALPTLLPAGILPDLLVAIDPLPENVVFFKDNPFLKHVPFMCLTQYTAEIVNVYPGPVFVNQVEQNLVTQWLSTYWEDKGTVHCFGGSVAHLGFAAADYLGCSTIALTGLDLSFDDKFHAGDASNLLSELHGKPFEFRKGAETAIDIFGETRGTLPSFLSFRTSFENRIKTFSGTVINASEAGLPLEGTVPMRLKGFIDEYCTAPPLDAQAEIARHTDAQGTYDLEGLIREVTLARDTLQDIRKTARQMLRYINKVQDLRKAGQGDGKEFHRLLDRIERLTKKVRHPVLNLIAAYHYQLELYLKRQNVVEIDEMDEGLERLDAQLDRGLTYYSELLEGIDLFVAGLRRVINDLKEQEAIDRILSDTSMPEAEGRRAAGLAFSRAGRVAFAAKHLEAARESLTNRPSPGYEAAYGSKSAMLSELTVLLAESYLRQYRYYEARELLEGLKGQGCPARAAGKQGLDEMLQTCMEKILAWEEKTQRMSELRNKAREAYGGSLESGLFYFRVGDYERAKRAYLEAISEQSEGSSAQLVNACYGLGHTYLKTGENQEAVDAFAEALRIDPDNPVIYRDLGLLAIENGNHDSGESFLVRALELAPRSRELYMLLGRFYQGVGDTQKAIALLERGVQLNPRDMELQKGLALLYQDVILQKENQEKEKAG